MNELQDHIALVTGSSRGIGAAIANVFAGQGAAVVVHGRDQDAVGAVTTEIRQSGGTALAVTADLTRYDEVEAMRLTIEDELGPVDILVANAGGGPVRLGPVEEIPVSEWQESLDANLTTTFLAIKAFLPGMKQRGRGNIITVSSAVARRPSGQSPVAYAAAKAAIELVTQAVAAQAGPAGVRVNCIAPETILTARNAEQIPADRQQQLGLAHPVQRLGVPDDIAQAALFLASDKASWISGVTVDVAGGSVLK